MIGADDAASSLFYLFDSNNAPQTLWEIIINRLIKLKINIGEMGIRGCGQCSQMIIALFHRSPQHIWDEQLTLGYLLLHSASGLVQ